MLRVLVYFLWILPAVVIADNSATTSIGGFAASLIAPVDVLSDFVGTAALIVGSSCLFGSVIRYMHHRVNPLAFPISTVVVLFILGVVLVCLPFMYKLTGYGIPYPSS
jgi:hypothetical protein